MLLLVMKKLIVGCMNFPHLMNTPRVALFNHFDLFGNRYKYGIMP